MHTRYLWDSPEGTSWRGHLETHVGTHAILKVRRDHQGLADKIVIGKCNQSAQCAVLSLSFENLPMKKASHPDKRLVDQLPLPRELCLESFTGVGR